jgi:hypothetical protein
VFGVYVWLGGTLRASHRAGARFRHASASPKHPNLPACLPAAYCLRLLWIGLFRSNCAAKCARAHFASKWSRPSHRPPQGRLTPLLRACIYYALGGERRQAAAEETKKKEKKIKEEEEEKSSHTPH